MSDELELQLVPPKPNGTHFCTERDLLDRLQNGQNKIGTEQTELKTMLSAILVNTRGTSDQLSDVITEQIRQGIRIGGPGDDPTDPDGGTGLYGAQMRMAARQRNWEREISSVRPRLQSIEDAGEITKTHSLDELVGRVHSAEALATKLAEEARQRAAQIEADAWAEAKARAEWKRQLTIKVVAIVGAALTSSAGLVWLARVFQ